MGTDNLTTIQAAVRAELADTGSDFTDAIINQAVSEVVSDISRLAPREQVHIEVLHSRTVSGESFTSSHDTWVSLANKPIDMQSTVTVTSDPAGTTYTEYTDYIIDYAQGRINVLSTGSMADATGFLITYEKSLSGIDISSLTDLIIIELVERAKSGGSNYQAYESWHKWGDILWLQSRNNQSQEKWSEDDHIRIWYKGEHSKPTTGAAGSYPAYLDDLVVKGAVAYSLFSKHRERQLQAITYNASAATQLAIADDDQSAIDTLLTAVTTSLDAANSALDEINSLVTANNPFADATTALDAAIIILGLLEDVTTAGEPFPDAYIAMNNAATLLDVTPAGAVEDALDKVVEHLESDTTNPDSAENQLAAGDSLINAINVGDQASLVYARYAEAQIAIANSFVSEGRARIEQALALVNESAQRIDTGRALQGTAGIFVREAEIRQNQAVQLTNVALAYVSEAQGRLTAVNQHITLGDLYLNQSEGYQNLADREIQISERLLLDARERHTDYWEHLTSRTEIARQERQQSTRQLPQNR